MDDRRENPEGHEEAVLTDAPKPEPKRSKHKLRAAHTRGEEEVVGRRPAPARAPASSKPQPSTRARFIIGCDLTEGDTDRLDAYRDALAHDSRASAARELILDGLERHDARRRASTEVKPPLSRRIALAWWVLCGSDRVRCTAQNRPRRGV